MEHKIYYDEHAGAVRLDFVGDWFLEEAQEMLPIVMKLLQCQKHHYLICDLSSGTNDLPSKELRRWLKENAPRLELNKIALLGMSPIMRMTGKIIVASFGKTKVARGFSTDEEAICWLKKEK